MQGGGLTLFARDKVFYKEHKGSTGPEELPLTTAMLAVSTRVGSRSVHKLEVGSIAGLPVPLLVCFPVGLYAN